MDIALQGRHRQGPGVVRPLAMQPKNYCFALSKVFSIRSKAKLRTSGSFGVFSTPDSGGFSFSLRRVACFSISAWAVSMMLRPRRSAGLV